MKKLILVTSPPACGKTYISKELSKALKHVVYLDKDTLITLSNQVFLAAKQEINRSSDFFEEYIRDFEYTVILNLALEALDYDDTVLINAPFTEEIRDLDFIKKLEEKLKQKGAKLIVIWVETSIEVCRARMVKRNSERDWWKLENWEEYISGCNFEKPAGIKNLILFKNSSDREFKSSMKNTLYRLNNTKRR